MQSDARQQRAKARIVLDHDVAHTVVRGKLFDCAPQSLSARHGSTLWKIHAADFEHVVLIEHNKCNASATPACNQDWAFCFIERIHANG